MNQSINIQLNSYRKISWITVIAVYFLILVGGIVRSTGSGMGCPDWPMCFGSVVPPTSIEQLPDNYQEIYLEKRLAKNERFVATLEKLGFSQTAYQIANDKSILVEEEFNATKTWIEYINRLVGVAIGFLIILTCWRSFPLWKVDKKIPIASLIALVLVLFTGWIGSIVVSTNLLAWMITFHMVLAIALVLVLLYGHFLVDQKRETNAFEIIFPKRIKIALIIGLVLMFVQVVLGTQVREEIDRISFALGDLLREEWVERVGLNFIIHRSFSLVILGVHLWYFFGVLKFSSRGSEIGIASFLLAIVLLLEISTGIGMAYFGIPAYLQPVHLVLGWLLLGIQFYLILRLRTVNKLKVNQIRS